MPIDRERAERGTILLGDVRRPGASELVDVVVRQGRIAGIRPAGTVALGDGVHRVDLAGRTVVPGLWDMHVHVTQWALARRRLDLFPATSAADVVRRVADTLAARDDVARHELLVGRRMRVATWPDRPHRDLLDRVAPDTPVVLTNIDLHTVWCNSRALERFGSSDHPDGVLREDECYRLISALPDGTRAQRDAAVAAALSAAAQRGVVGVKDYEFGDCVPDWQRRVAAGPPPVRVETTVYRSHLDDAISRGRPTGTVVADTAGLVRTGHLKVFVDGAINSGTALCHDPVVTAGAAAAPTPAPTLGDDEGHRAGDLPDRHGGDLPVDHGHLVMPPAELEEVVARAWRHGIAPAVHAIGDRAVTIALDVVEAVGCPARIEHAQLVADRDLPRFDRPDLVAGVQPAHCTDDRDVTDLAWADRAHRAYRFRDLVAAGARLEFGSDAPVSPLDPWAAIAAAVRRTADDRPAWHPDQRLGVATALAASARGRHDLHVGDPADLAVLDDDPLRVDTSVLADPDVHATMVDGRFTHGP